MRLNSYFKFIFKREKFNMKNNEIGFYSFKQFGYFSLPIGDNGSSVEVFRLSSIDLKDKTLKYLKKQRLFLGNLKRNVSYVPTHRKRRW